MRHNQVRRVEAIEARLSDNQRWDYMIPRFLPQTQEEALAVRNAELEREGFGTIPADARIACLVFRQAAAPAFAGNAA